MGKNYLSRGNKVKMIDGRILTVKSLEFREFIAVEEIGYQKKNDIVEVIESGEKINKTKLEKIDLETIAHLIANKANMPYCWEDIKNRLLIGEKMPFKLTE